VDSHAPIPHNRYSDIEEEEPSRQAAIEARPPPGAGNDIGVLLDPAAAHVPDGVLPVSASMPGASSSHVPEPIHVGVGGSGVGPVPDVMVEDTTNYSTNV
jgi:hypothetical protein